MSEILGRHRCGKGRNSRGIITARHRGGGHKREHAEQDLLHGNLLDLDRDRQTWGLRAKVRSARDHGTLFYQIGGAG